MQVGQYHGIRNCGITRKPELSPLTQYSRGMLNPERTSVWIAISGAQFTLLSN
jgi:hypothetical protein